MERDLVQRKSDAILYAFLAAVFYAVNVPVSKILLREVGPTTMAALLYLGAGMGIGLLSLFRKEDQEKAERLWAAVFLITLSSFLLSFEGTGSFQFSYGSLFVLLATICWGFENNCTRKISSKSTYEIVVLKGIFSGLGSLIIAFIKKETMPELPYVAAALVLGFIA